MGKYIKGWKAGWDAGWKEGRAAALVEQYRTPTHKAAMRRGVVVDIEGKVMEVLEECKSLLPLSRTEVTKLVEQRWGRAYREPVHAWILGEHMKSVLSLGEESSPWIATREGRQVGSVVVLGVKAESEFEIPWRDYL